MPCHEGADPLEIRPYRESDQDAVVALWQECALVRPWNDPVKDIHRKLRMQRDLFLSNTSPELAAGRPGTPIQPNSCSISSMVVTASRRSQAGGPNGRRSRTHSRK